MKLFIFKLFWESDDKYDLVSVMSENKKLAENVLQTYISNWSVKDKEQVTFYLHKTFHENEVVFLT